LAFSTFFFSSSGPHRALHSFPTRRSSDLSVALSGGVLIPAIALESAIAALGRVVAPMSVQPIATLARPLVAIGALMLSIEGAIRSEEHTSELQSRFDLVCRLLLEKKNDMN